MATRYYSFAPEEYYHIYNRGNSKQVIFKTEQDFERFKSILYIANTTERFTFRQFKDGDIFDIDRTDPLVHIGAYSLLPNHFHLLLTPAQDDGVPKFMLKLATSYGLYFNKKYMRVGALYEGPYRARYADSDRYLKYLYAYVHLNPFRSKDGAIKHFLDTERLLAYTHSSLPDYLGAERNEKKILSPQHFPVYFESIKTHKKDLFEWIDYYSDML